MNKRLANSKNPNDCRVSNQPRRSKKRNNRNRSSPNEFWYNNDKDRESQGPSEDEVPGMEYTSMYWQQPHPAHNGQRLFTAMSDPSVCGYSAVPVTYAMEPISLPPMYRLYQPVVRPNYRSYRGKSRSSFTHIQNRPSCSSDTLGNGYSSLQENGWCWSTTMAYQNGDYASLPPTANIDHKNDGKDLSSEQRRYSDPGLGPAELSTSKNRDTDSVESGSSITTIGKSSKLVISLIEQMTKMKDTNNQLFKELHQAKSDLETVKTELNQFKQNVPSNYQPGMLSDIIKEIRDASRIKEEAMLSKMKLLMENQQSQRSSDLEQLKNQLDKVRREKEESEERIAKLEKEVAALRLSFNSENREIAAFEEENLALRRELQEARASRNLAESHATKCVNAALALGVLTPVNFEPLYSPCITTSTPVRTVFESNKLPIDPSLSVGSLCSTDANHDSLQSSPGSSLLQLLDVGGEFETDSTIPAVSRTESTQKNNDWSNSRNSSRSNSSNSNNETLTESQKSEGTTNQEQNSMSSIEPGKAKDKPDCALVTSSVVNSKDLSLTNNILTSRVLTAPSRATYTTAYI